MLTKRYRDLGLRLLDPRNRFANIDIELPNDTEYPVLQKDFAPKSRPDCGERSYKGYGRLIGRRALITGGDSGIGRAVAIAMAREGAKVAINYLQEEAPDAKDVSNLLAQEGVDIVRIAGDLRDEKFCSELVMKAHRELGGLDIVVNNAGSVKLQLLPRNFDAEFLTMRYSFGGTLNEDITTYSSERLERTFRTNVFAGFFIVRAAIPLLPPGSSIIWTVSDVVANPVSALHDYAASKEAVASLVSTLAASLASKGIRVNGVAPGLTYTPLLATSGLSTEQLEQFARSLPIGRIAQPVEMAPLYVDFADDARSYTSGSILQNNGGAISYNVAALGGMASLSLKD